MSKESELMETIGSHFQEQCKALDTGPNIPTTTLQIMTIYNTIAGGFISLAIKLVQKEREEIKRSK